MTPARPPTNTALLAARVIPPKNKFDSGSKKIRNDYEKYRGKDEIGETDLFAERRAVSLEGPFSGDSWRAGDGCQSSRGPRLREEAARRELLEIPSKMEGASLP
jgi:hypothetical protein